MAGALDGVKILGFTHFAQGPFALQMLGDLGAEVINIERQGSGDFNRHFQQLDNLGGEGVFFLAMNRNKRSMSLNLKAPESREIVEKLIAQSDVIMTNYRAGALDRLGFGFEEARKINPRIVFCEALGYGSSGPYASLPGQDLLAQALSGLTTMIGPDEDGRPVAGGIYEVDVYGSLMLVIGMLSALYYAKQTGIGQKVSVDLLSSGVHMQSQELAYFLNSGKVPQRAHNHSGHVLQASPYGVYKTGDGWMVLSTNAGDNPAMLGELIGSDEVAPLMTDNEAKMTNRDQLHTIIEGHLVLQPTEYWIEKFRAVGIWCAKVNSYEDLPKDPQIIHNGIIKEIDHPVAGTFKAIGTPIEFSETPPTIRRTPPALGEHNDEILQELGFSDVDIERFRQAGIF
ncbi:MAG: CoA transferase [Clostridiales bacterium]|nr:CoA transferase [Clostridiales bacterium]